MSNDKRDVLPVPLSMTYVDNYAVITREGGITDEVLITTRLHNELKTDEDSVYEVYLELWNIGATTAYSIRPGVPNTNGLFFVRFDILVSDDGGLTFRSLMNSTDVPSVPGYGEMLNRESQGNGRKLLMQNFRFAKGSNTRLYYVLGYGNLNPATVQLNGNFGVKFIRK